MTHLFISHSSADRTVALQVCSRLREAGYQSVFLDIDPTDGVAAGQRWERTLYRHLRSSDGVVFIGSPTSMTSRWCFAELALARSLGTPIFMLRADPTCTDRLLPDLQWVTLGGEEGYQRLLDGLRIAGLDPTRSFAWDPSRTPYPGLRSFTGSDAAVFFGRTAETRQLLELLHPTLARGSGRWVSIVGPSGSGKSSLLHAGLIPELARRDDEWVVLPAFVPGREPLRHLAQTVWSSLVDAGIPPACTADQLEHELATPVTGPQRLAEHLASLARRRGTSARSVLISIDQAEELITRCDRQQQVHFLDVLQHALQRTSNLWVVCTMRSEFLSTDPERAGLCECIDDSLIVEPLSRGRLVEVIAGPARRAGLEFDPGLVQRMIEDTTGGDALPLLAHTLYELSNRARSDAITVTDYESIGGVLGAMQGRADRLLAESARYGLSELVLPTLLKLVTVDPSGEPVRRRLDRRSLVADELTVVDLFVEARLLTSGRIGPKEPTTVEVAHEALLRQWIPLRDAIEHARDELVIRADLERASSDWDREHRDESYLLRGSRLLAVQEWLSRTRAHLTPVEGHYLAASRDHADGEVQRVRRANRRLHQLLGGAVGLLCLALVSSVLAYVSAARAEKESDLAQSRQLISDAVGVRDTQPDLSLLLGVEAVRRAPAELRPDAIVDLRVGLRGSFHRSVRLEHPDAVTAVDFSADGSVLATAGKDGSVRIWNTLTGAPVGQPLVISRVRVNSVAFSPQPRDGSLLAFGDDTGGVWIWRPGAGRPHRLDTVTGRLSDLKFSHDGTRIFVTTISGRLFALPVAGGPKRSLLDHTGAQLRRVAVGPDGVTLVISGTKRGHTDGTMFWVRLGRRTSTTPVHRPSIVTGLSFAAGGSLLVSAEVNGTVELWNGYTGKPIGPSVHDRPAEVTDVVFGPFGRWVAASGAYGRIRLWRIRNGRLQTRPFDSLTGHANAVRRIAVSPDGLHLASASFDRTARIWELNATRAAAASLLPMTELTGPGKRPNHRTNTVAYSADGSMFLVAGADGQLTVYDRDLAIRRRIEVAPGSDVTGAWIGDAAFSPDRSMIVTGSKDHHVRLWYVDGADPKPLLDHQLPAAVGSVAFSPDGARVVAGDSKGNVDSWSVQDRSDRGLEVKGIAGVTDIAFVDPTTVVWSDKDGQVSRWRLGDPQPRVAGERHTGWILCLAVDPVSGLLATAGGDGIIRVWNSTDLSLVATLEDTYAELDGVAFQSGGKILAAVGKDGMLRLWDVGARRIIGTGLPTATAEVTTVAFDPHRFALLTGGPTGQVWYESFEETDTLLQACSLAHRDLTPAEWARYVPTADEPPRRCRG